jgi:hypothetical protein
VEHVQYLRGKEITMAILNNLVGVFEYEVDEAGNTQYKVWEWK